MLCHTRVLDASMSAVVVPAGMERQDCPRGKFPCPPQEEHVPSDLPDLQQMHAASHLFSVAASVQGLCPELPVSWLAVKASDGRASMINTGWATHDSRDLLRASQSSTHWLLNHKKPKCLSTQTLIFKAAWRSSFSGTIRLYFAWLNCLIFFDFNRNVSCVGGSCTRWRGNAALEWRSWRLWLKVTCRTGSPSQTSSTKPSPSWGNPCWRTAATPDSLQTFLACFLTPRTTWLHCVFTEEQESPASAAPLVWDTSLGWSSLKGQEDGEVPDQRLRVHLSFNPKPDVLLSSDSARPQKKN